MNETVANLSHLPGELIEMIRAALAGQAFVAAVSAAPLTRSRPHPRRRGPRPGQSPGPSGVARAGGRERDIALALIIARVCRPASKLARTRWWADTTLAADLGVADATTDEV
jgi:hypothetical protein